jgi:hypothetical protein
MSVTTGRRIQRGASSVMKRAMPMLTGTARTSAITEITRVPNENASVPKTALAGSQTSLVK